MEESTKTLDVPQRNKDMFNVPLCDSYIVLSHVFRYLSCETLKTTAMVSRVWSDIVNREKYRRGPCALMECCKSRNVSVCASWNQVLNIKESSIKSSVGFVFVPITTSGRTKRRIFHVLSEHCETIILFLSSFITYDVEIEYPCAFLPETPNVKINTVKVTERNLRQNEYKEYIDTISKVSTQDKKYLILFYTDKTHFIVNELISIALENGLNFIVDGKVNWGIQYTNYNESQNAVSIQREKYYLDMDCCVAFLITGSVDVYMTFIREKSKTEEQIEKDLKLFKNKIKLKNHSVGFEFAYGDKSYTEALATNYKKLETMIFKKLFPEVPLIGIFENNWIPERGELQKNISQSVIQKLLQETLPTTNFKNKISTMHMILTYD